MTGGLLKPAKWRLTCGWAQARTQGTNPPSDRGVDVSWTNRLSLTNRVFPKWGFINTLFGVPRTSPVPRRRVVPATPPSDLVPIFATSLNVSSTELPRAGAPQSPKRRPQRVANLLTNCWVSRRRLRLLPKEYVFYVRELSQRRRFGSNSRPLQRHACAAHTRYLAQCVPERGPCRLRGRKPKVCPNRARRRG